MRYKLIAALFLFSSFTFGQWVRPQTNPIFSFDTTQSGLVYFINTDVEDSIGITINKGLKHIDTLSMVNGTLRPNVEQLSSANRWATNLGSWTSSGNMSATRQSDSSVTLSNIPTELNPSPNMLGSWATLYQSDFSSSENLSETALISSYNYDGISDGTLSYDNTYKGYADGATSNHLAQFTAGQVSGDLCRFTGSVYLPSANTNANGVLFGNSFNSPTIISGSLTITKGAWTNFDLLIAFDNNYGTRFYETKDGTTSFTGANSSSNDIMYLYNIKMEKQVLPTGWTASTMTKTNYVFVQNDGLKFVSNGTSIPLTSGNILTSGHTYKYTITVTITSNGIKFDASGGNPSDITITTTGTHTGTFVADGATVVLNRNSGAANALVTYLSITEVKEPDEFTLSSQTTDAKKNYKLRFEAKSSLSNKKVYYSHGDVIDSLSLTSSYQTVNKEFWGQGTSTIKFWASGSTTLDVKDISLEEITTKRIISQDSTINIYFTPNTSSIGTKSASITLNNNKTFNFLYSVKYADSLLFADSDTTNLGILTANYIDFDFILHNISPVDTVDMHAWLNLVPPFYITSYPLGWYIMPNDSGIFEMRINHLSVDTLYSVNVGFIASDVSDNFRDTLWHTFVVDMQVNSNTLLKPIDLIASDDGEDILVTFNDPNIPDTTIAKNINFLVSSDVNLFTTTTGTTLSYDVGKLKVAQASGYGGYTWNKAAIDINVVQGQKYYFSVDAQKGTAKSVWLVLFNPSILPYESNLIANLSSTSNITFNYTYTATYSGTLRIYLQTNTDVSSGQYGYFDNLLVKQTEPSYDSFIVERQSWYQNSPNGDFAVLKTISSGALSFRDTVSDNTQWAYKVRFKKGEIYSDYSNSDTALFKLPSVIDPITADYYVGDETATGTWSTNTLENPMPFSLFYSGYSTNLTATNKKVYFIPGIEIKFNFTLGMVDPTAWTFSSLPSGTILFSDSSNRPIFTAKNELYGWDDPNNWVYAGSQPSLTGINTWKYIVEDHYSGSNATSIGSIGATYVALDSVIKPYYFASSYTGYASLSTDSAFYRPSTDYPYTLRSWTGTTIATTGINVYTGSSTVKPSEYFNSITVMGACKKLISFNNCDNLTIDGLSFEGGDSYTVEVINCDNFTFKNSKGSKYNLRFMWVTNCDGVLFEHNTINPGFDEWQGGRIWFEYYWYQGVVNFNGGSKNIVMRNNTLLNSTSGTFDLAAETNPVTNLRFYNNYVAMSSEGLLPYFRPFQISNELGGGTTNPNYVPSDIYVYNNIFKHGSREIKIAGKDVYIFNNVFEDFGIIYNAQFDHGVWYNPISTQSIFSTEQIYLLENTYTNQAHKWVFNNTFVNNQESFWQAINNTKLKKNYFHLVNNLFANQSIRTANNYKGANDLYAYGSTDYATYHLDFTIYHSQYQSNNDGIWDLRNNYHYSDYTSSSSDKTVIYGGTLSGSYYNPNYYTWAELNSADIATDNFSGNIADYSSSSLSDIINLGSNYEPTSLIKSAGLNLNEIKTIYGASFTDRWGNQITDAAGNFVGTMNIGANNKKINGHYEKHTNNIFVATVLNAQALELIYDEGSLNIPNASDALVYLDGTIIQSDGNYYFKDKTKNRRNFLITNYDFNSGWTKGFPYKSLATISAPSGDLTLIANDVNHFFYAADSTPNQIPVISLFQDIEYEHKIFCKHESRTINSDSIETYEPRVSKIVIYDNAKSGSNLTTCQTFFNVPTENTTTMAWISPNGSDAIGDGSKSNPYATLYKIRETTKTTIYMKGGNYAISSTSSFSGGTLKIIGLGFVNITFSAKYISGSRSLYFYNINFDGNGTGYPFIPTGFLYFKSCKITKSQNAFFVATNPNATIVTFRDCILSTATISIIDPSFGVFDSLLIDGCYGNTTVSLGNPNYIKKSSFRHNNLLNSTIYLTGTYGIDIYDNLIDNHSSLNKVAMYISGANNQSTNENVFIKYNSILANNNSGYIFYIGGLTEQGYNVFNKIIYEYNKIDNIYIGTTSNTSHTLFIGGGVDNTIRYNYLSCGNGYHIVIKAGGYHYTTTDAHISYNILDTKNGGRLIEGIYNRGAYGVNYINNTFINFNGNDVFKSDADVPGNLDNSIYVANNIIDLDSNVTNLTNGANATNDYNSIILNGYTLTESLNTHDNIITIALDSSGTPTSKVEDGQTINGDNNIGLKSDYVIPYPITFATQGANWQRGAVILP